MKNLLVLWLLIIFGFAHDYYRLPNIVKRVRPSVVYVQVQDEFGGGWSGSGMVVSDGLIMTAAHVIEDANDITVTFDDGSKMVSTEFFKLSTDSVDIGLIVIENTADPLHFSRLESRPGDTVFTIGSPYGLENCVAAGIFSNHAYIGDERLHQLDINGASGMSGCPVFNRYGSVIGILVRGNCSGMAFIVPAETCKFVVDVYENVQRAKIN